MLGAQVPIIQVINEKRLTHHQTIAVFTLIAIKVHTPTPPTPLSLISRGNGVRFPVLDSTEIHYICQKIRFQN